MLQYLHVRVPLQCLHVKFPAMLSDYVHVHVCTHSHVHVVMYTWFSVLYNRLIECLCGLGYECGMQVYNVTL